MWLSQVSLKPDTPALHLVANARVHGSGFPEGAKAKLAFDAHSHFMVVTMDLSKVKA